MDQIQDNMAIINREEEKLNSKLLIGERKEEADPKDGDIMIQKTQLVIPFNLF